MSCQNLLKVQCNLVIHKCCKINRIWNELCISLLSHKVTKNFSLIPKAFCYDAKYISLLFWYLFEQFLVFCLSTAKKLKGFNDVLMSLCKKCSPHKMSKIWCWFANEQHGHMILKNKANTWNIFVKIRWKSTKYNGIYFTNPRDNIIPNSRYLRQNVFFD